MEPKNAYMLMSEYCFIAALPLCVLLSFSVVPAMDHLGFDNTWARAATYGLPTFPLLGAALAYVECAVRAAMEPGAFDLSWMKPGYSVPRRVDFLTNADVLMASSLANIAVSLTLGILLAAWNPASLSSG